MKTTLTAKELSLMTVVQLLNTYEYAILKYKGNIKEPDLQNLRREIELRMFSMR